MFAIGLGVHAIGSGAAAVGNTSGSEPTRIVQLFQKINNLGIFFKNVLRAVSAILGGTGHV